MGTADTSTQVADTKTKKCIWAGMLVSTLLAVNDLSIQYETMSGPVKAVNGVSFEMKQGSTVGIVGESACGKSTLGLGIMRTLQGGHITSGSVTFDGERISDMGDTEFDAKYRWNRISMIFQGAMNSLDPVYTVREQFEEILQERRAKPKVVSDAVESVNLDKSILDRYPHELSGGMKQRVVIAMALLLKPNLVIADEPTTALDVLIQARIVNMLKGLKRQGTSFLFITHDLALLSEIADVVGIMYAGQLVEIGSADQIYTNPKHPYTQGLLASVPRLHGSPPGYIRGVPPSLRSPPEGCRFAERCGKAFEKCTRDPPEYIQDSDMVKCWLYE